MTKYKLEGIWQDVHHAKITSKNERSHSWGRETHIPFDLLYTTLSDYLRLPVHTRFCKIDTQWDGPNIVCYNLSNKTLGSLGYIRFSRKPNYVDIEYYRESGKRQGEMYAELLGGWLQKLETDAQRIRAQATTRSNRTWSEDEEKEARNKYNKAVTLIEQGQTVERASQLAGISKATYYNYKDIFE